MEVGVTFRPSLERAKSVFLHKIGLKIDQMGLKMDQSGQCKEKHRSTITQVLSSYNGKGVIVKKND